ncbi:MAG: GIY-YIG nuclease family protein [Bacteroidetes bacterium]|nr:GIY-YIG nuclease family protein [Bacteroidota bacterium]
MIQKQLATTPIDDTVFSVIDVETTGLSAKTNHVIEIGIVKVRNYKIVDKYESLINPGTSIPMFITQFTGIANHDVADAPHFSEVIEDITQFLGDTVVSGHNLSFDSSFLKYEFLRCGSEPLYNEQLCTLKLTRRMYPDLQSKSLTAVAKHLNLKNKSAHRALSDAEVTARVLIKMIAQLKRESKIHTSYDLINFQQKMTVGRTIKVIESLKEDISSLPNTPGIYYFVNNRNKIIYVGKAKSLRDRVRTYFSPTAPKKAKKIIKQARRLKIEITNTELTALLSEAETIKKINPKHNYQLKKYGLKYFLKVTKDHSYPRIEITNHFDFDGNDYFGLFISRRKAESVLEIVDKTFRLRECSDKEFSKHKKCFLAEIERCTAPCVYKSSDEYNKELNKVYEFLFGKNQTALNRLLKTMKGYSDLENYEKAAEVKKIIYLILNQTHKTSLLAEPVNSADVLFEVSGGYGKDYILLLTGKIYVKNFVLYQKDLFEEALEDYFNKTINYDFLPSDEDLEKIKITLNWLIKNRNKVRIFYLKDYSNKDDLYSNIKSISFSNTSTYETSFDIKDLAIV